MLLAPNEGVYKLLKGAVVGGPNLVFTREHEAGKTKIRGHQYDNPKASKRVLGYELNTRTMQQDMLWGPLRELCRRGRERGGAVENQKNGLALRFAEVDIEVQKKQWKKFTKFPPMFYNSQIPVEVGITRKELAAWIPKPKSCAGDWRGKSSWSTPHYSNGILTTG